LLIRPAWPGAATRDENRACPAKLGFPCQVFTEREERSSIAIASNSAFSEWARTFTDPRLCAAIVDRLTFDASIIETGTESFRLRTTNRRRNTPRAS
jgi:DNA replication protein DnaC